ncbi:MAG: XRE family transcriptional regulator [Oscillospiraceae bacterium]|jgi:transcriptional regulator with XRE-family HTH domain|nr:XRE family transcriptional regulator [Oscillospiraceae bacterium]
MPEIDINREIAQRIASSREEANLTPEAFAEKTGIDAETLKRYESGDLEIPVAALHNMAPVLGVSVTELMTGEPAKLHRYCIVRAGKGAAVNRKPSYHYRALASNYAAHEMEPYFITIPVKPEEEPFEMTRHTGQEFHYVLTGSYAVRIANDVLILQPGDSLYFDASQPHGLKALNGEAAQAIIVITAE